mmetsp:Transcript_91475/g.285127  ORF Transcript_91475/g.285127 Transcript_91475/m.285127 type:complete len:209 (-) Transcript_91475:8-634(-)
MPAATRWCLRHRHLSEDGMVRAARRLGGSQVCRGWRGRTRNRHQRWAQRAGGRTRARDRLEVCSNASSDLVLEVDLCVVLHLQDQLPQLAVGALATPRGTPHGPCAQGLIQALSDLLVGTPEQLQELTELLRTVVDGELLQLPPAFLRHPGHKPHDTRHEFVGLRLRGVGEGRREHQRRHAAQLVAVDQGRGLVVVRGPGTQAIKRPH